MRNVNMIGVVLGAMLATAACVTETGEEATSEEAEATTEAANASQICRRVKYFDYVQGNVVTHWDVTDELFTGRTFVDEYRSGHRIQYSATNWKNCPSNTSEFVILRAPNGITLSGTHLCLNDQANREELHPQQSFQRLLVPRWPYVAYNCDP